MSVRRKSFPVGIFLLLMFVALMTLLYVYHGGRNGTQQKDGTHTTILHQTNLFVQEMSPNEDPECSLCQVYNLQEQIRNDYNCVIMKLDVKAPICLYPLDKDIYVSKNLSDTGVWEVDFIQMIDNWMYTDNEIGLIDIGANLGVFTLSTAARGRKVLAIEPNLENARHLHAAVNIGHLAENITLLLNCVGDERRLVKLRPSKKNQGDTQFRMKTGEFAQEENGLSQMITLDDIVEFCVFKKAVIKIDVQGWEHRAFAQASRLFDAVQILYVLMEWEMMPRYARSNNTLTHQNDRKLVDNMVNFFMERGFIPKTVEGIQLKEQEWSLWPRYVVWEGTAST